eukprot:965024-Prymnesium_polylepis.2
MFAADSCTAFIRCNLYPVSQPRPYWNLYPVATWPVCTGANKAGESRVRLNRPDELCQARSLISLPNIRCQWKDAPPYTRRGPPTPTAYRSSAVLVK